MVASDDASSYTALGLSSDASLEEVDDRYLELTSRWSAPDPPGGKEEGKRQQQLLDEAYKIILSNFIKLTERKESGTEGFTMKQVTNAQDRISILGASDMHQWFPPDTLRITSQKAKSYSGEMNHPTGDNTGMVPGFSIQEIQGDIIDAPDRAVIVRKCDKPRVRQS